jgi:hypothetical protein
MNKSELKALIKECYEEVVDEYRTAGAVGKKFRPEIEITPEKAEVPVFDFLSSRKDNDIHIDQLWDIANALELTGLKSDVDLLFNRIVEKLDGDPKLLVPLYRMLVDRGWIK